jgi:hypothetical protein
LTYPKALSNTAFVFKKLDKKIDSRLFYLHDGQQQQHLVMSTSTTAKSFVTSGTTPITTPTNTLSKSFGSFRLLKTK